MAKPTIPKPAREPATLRYVAREMRAIAHKRRNTLNRNERELASLEEEWAARFDREARAAARGKATDGNAHHSDRQQARSR